MSASLGILARVLAVAVVLSVAACSDPPRESFRFGLANMPVTLDPRFATDAASTRINRLLYERLVDFNEASLPVPALATWERFSPTYYRFTLQPSAFHNGMALTAYDVKATYDFILDEANASPHRATLTHVRSIDVFDERTVDFILNRDDPLFPALLVVGIVPDELARQGHPFNRRPVGSGPFVFAGWSREGTLRLRRQADMRMFEFIKVPDPTVRVLKLLRGEIDMIQNDLPPELVRFLSNDPRVRVTKASGSNFSYLGFNMEDAVTGQLAVRQAIALALDRNAIVEHVFGGAARPASSLLVPDHWAGDATLNGYPYDPERARELLAEAGYTTERPARIEYKTSSDPLRIRLATIIQRQLDEVGIEVNIRSYDWGTFYGDIKAGKFQMFSLTWVGIKTPDIFHYAFHSESVPPNGANRGRYTNQVVDRLIEAARINSDLELQAVQYRSLQRLLLIELPYVPLWYEDHIFVARPDVEGYVLAVDGNYDGLIHVKRAQERLAAPVATQVGEVRVHG